MAAAAGYRAAPSFVISAARRTLSSKPWTPRANGLANALHAARPTRTTGRPCDEPSTPCLKPYHRDPTAALASTRLIQDAPSLYARQMEKQHSWRFILAQALADRNDIAGPVPLPLSVKATAALACLNVALDKWTTSDGQLDLVDLLDDAFALRAAMRRQTMRRQAVARGGRPGGSRSQCAPGGGLEPPTSGSKGRRSAD